jgi:hypothetical protein
MTITMQLCTVFFSWCMQRDDFVRTDFSYSAACAQKQANGRLSRSPEGTNTLC